MMIKKQYWILIGSFSLLTLLAVIGVIQEIVPEAVAKVSLAGVAIVISIFAMAISDRVKPKFKGQVTAKAIVRGNNDDVSRSFITAFKILNKGKDSIEDFVYKVRFPQRFSHADNKNRHVKSVVSGRTRILTDSSFGFLGGTKDHENEVPVSLNITLRNWKSDNIYITVSGENISATTFVLRPDSSDKLLAGETIQLTVR